MLFHATINHLCSVCSIMLKKMLKKENVLCEKFCSKQNLKIIVENSLAVDILRSGIILYVLWTYTEDILTIS